MDKVPMKLFLSGSGMIGVLVYAVIVVYLKWNTIEVKWNAIEEGVC